MIPTITSGLILMKKRRMMDVFPPHLRKLWKEWELVGAALLSLTLQIVLIVSGNRRKYIHRVWFRVIVWFAYMLADSVATIALGILSNDLGQIYEDVDHIDVANELKAFWAPFFLLHLGGPDTITAYSLEDNELYLRHFFGLIVQTTVALYILILAWTSSHLSYLSTVVVVVGCIKYGERTLSLWEASRNKLRKTFLSDPDPGPNYSKFMEECRLKDAEGFCVDIIMEYPDNFDVTASVKPGSEHNIIQAHVLFQTFKTLFADLILSFHDRESSQALFKYMSDENAFDVIGIELGFMYDLLYTKAPAIYTPWGLARRFITFFLTCFAFLYFILDDVLSYKSIDAVVTLLLLVVAVLLEIYAALGFLVSDQTRTWLIKHRKIRTAISFLEKRFACFEVQRWSKSMGQYSLLWLSLKEKRSLEIIEEFRYKEYRNFTTEYRNLIFKHVREKSIRFEDQRKILLEQTGTNCRLDTALKEFCSKWRNHILDNDKLDNLQRNVVEWSISLEFDQSILIWHMATEICYYSQDIDEKNFPKEVQFSRDFSLHMSRYMFYLLVICPFMLPEGIGFIRLRETRAEIMEFLKVQMLDGGGVLDKRKEACKLLLDVYTDIPHIQGGDTTKSVLSNACRLASMLTVSDEKHRWDLMRDMWLELLAYAACHCKGSQHAQQLRRGGELLTHVWLLMAHFGLSNQFQVSHHRAIPLLSTK